MATAIAKSTFPATGSRTSPISPTPHKTRPSLRPFRSFPIPREDSFYSQAKKYEYVQKDLDKASFYYLKCIETGVRAESALKDLASLWHQRGWTQRACDLLKENERLIKDDVESYRNLLSNLEEKAQNRNPRYLLLRDLPRSITEQGIRDLFTHPQRIMEVEIIPTGEELVMARLKCMSISAAKKTIGSFMKRKEMPLEIEDLSDKGTDVSDSFEADDAPKASTASPAQASALMQSIAEDSLEDSDQLEGFDMSQEELLGSELMHALEES